MLSTILFVFVFWIAPVIVAVRLGHQRGRNGWIWGILLGWIGVVIMLLLPRGSTRGSI